MQGYSNGYSTLPPSLNPNPVIGQYAPSQQVQLSGQPRLGSVPSSQSNETIKVQPLLCSGHTRPVTHLQFSNVCVVGDRAKCNNTILMCEQA